MQEGGDILWDYPKEHLVFIRDESLSFCEIWNNPNPPLFFIRCPFKQALQDMEFYNNFADRLEAASKEKNPAVSKVKV